MSNNNTVYDNIMAQVDNIIYGDTARAYMDAGFDLMKQGVVSTLGPNGRTVIYKNHITKDGVTVARDMQVKDPALNKVLTLIKDACAYTEKVAGDGTTTTALYAHTLYRYARKMEVELNYNSRMISDVFNRVIPMISETLNEYQKPILKEDGSLDLNLLEKAIYTTVNGDSIITGLLLEAVSKLSNYSELTLSTAIRVISTESDECSVDVLTGSFYDTGYSSAASINVPDHNKVHYHNPTVIILRGKLPYSRELIDTLSKITENGRPALLFVDSYDDDDVGYTLRALNGRLITIAKLPGFGNARENLTTDISKIINGSVAEDIKFTVNGVVVSYSVSAGEVSEATLTSNTCTLVGESDTSTHAQTLFNLANDSKLDAYERGKAMERYQSFNGNLVTIKIGGMSSVEMTERLHRAVDGLRSATCAIRDGVVYGAGYTMVHVGSNLTTNLSREGVSQVEAELIDNICLASYNELNNCNKSGCWQMVNSVVRDVDVIDPLLVTKTALISANRLVTMLINTDTIILDAQLSVNNHPRR